MIGQFVKRNKGWIAIVVALAVAAVGGVLYYNKSSIPVATMTVVDVKRGNVKAVVSATGTIAAVNSVQISSRVTGLITEVKAVENDMVKAGQVLVVLDDSAVREQVNQYQIQMSNYAAIYERSKKLAAIGGESAQQLEADRTNYLVAQSTYNNNLSQLGYYVIKAPVSGMVIGTPTPAGQTVVQGISAAQVLMTIADMSKMQINTLVDETDIGKVKVGQKVSFTVDAYTDKVFTGKVTSVSRNATTSSNVVYYPVYVLVDSPEDLLYPTMTARVVINVAEQDNTVLVPLAAVKEESGHQYVDVMANGKTQHTPVTVGIRDDENVEIVSGLTEGDQISIPLNKESSTTTTQKQQGPPPPM